MKCYSCGVYLGEIHRDQKYQIAMAVCQDCAKDVELLLPSVSALERILAVRKSENDAKKLGRL